LTRYVALLRGINVGGKSLIKMDALRACLSELGEVESVSTYIASGNVLFSSAVRDAAALEASIEAAIEARFSLPVKVVVLDRAAYGRVLAAIPGAWIGDETVRANVAFVRRGTDAAEAIRELSPDPALEEILAVPGAILWATRRDALNRSATRKLIGGAAYKELTIRSLNTTLKLRELLDEE
jgi:uncharacterized protein (DUF1697 family)